MIDYEQRTRDLLNCAANAASDKLATNIIAFDVAERMPLTDAFMLVTAESERQVGAVVDEIESRLAEQGIPVQRREGFEEKTWVLLDFGDLIVHIQTPAEREYYALDRIWGDCKEIPLDLDTQSKARDV